MSDPMAPVDGEGTPGRDAIRAQLERILASPQFANAPSMGKMLRFVVGHALDGTADRIKEYTLGVEVFGRGSDFDPRQDTIVRVQARRLRERLADYYAEQGAGDPVGISLPTGHYVPDFQWRQAPPDSPAVTATDARPVPKSWRMPAMLAVGVVVLLALALTTVLNRGPRPAPATGEAAHRIVVLPFIDMSPNRDKEYIADGLTEELIHQLAQSPSLQVIARTSAFAFKGRTDDVSSIARALDVDRVIEGSVRHDGDRVRITVQLIDAATNTHLWSQTYDRSPDDLFTVQGEIAEAAAATLQAGTRRGQVVIAPDPEAYALYLRSRFHLNRRGKDDIDRAESLLRQAVEIDPDFPRAWEGLATALTLQTARGKLSTGDGMSQVAAAARHALALDPTLVEARVRLSASLMWAGDRAGADAEMQRAWRQDPNHPLGLAIAADVAQQQLQLRLAVELWRRALNRDPLSASSAGNLAGALAADEQFDAAEAEIQRLIGLYPEHGPAMQVLRASMRVDQGRFDEALRLVQPLPESTSRNHVLALAYAGLGDRQRAEAALAKLPSPKGPAMVYNRHPAVTETEAWMLLGDSERALASLLRVPRPDTRTAEGIVIHYTLNAARAVPRLRPLHADPRWQAWAHATFDPPTRVDLSPLLAATGQGVRRKKTVSGIGPVAD